MPVEIKQGQPLPEDGAAVLGGSGPEPGSAVLGGNDDLEFQMIQKIKDHDDLEFRMREKIKDLLMAYAELTDTVIYNAIAVDSKGRTWRLNVTLGEFPLLSRLGTGTWPEVAIPPELDRYLLSCDYTLPNYRDRPFPGGSGGDNYIMWRESEAALEDASEP
jgi:hypothetical protein